MISRPARTGLLATALFAVGAAAAPAATAPDTLSFAFTTAKAKAPAGYSVEGGFPRQRIIDRITIDFPAGTTFDTSALPKCASFTDEEVKAAERGISDICPATSKLGTGKGTAFIADNPSPAVFDLDLYNRANGAILDIKLGGKTAFAAYPTITGRRMTIPLTLTPGLKARITAFELTVPRMGKLTKPYLRTPAACPANKKLTATITAGENGAGSVATKDTTACRR